MPTPNVVLVTGGAKRIGKSIATRFHAAGWRVIIHCRSSNVAAAVLASEFNHDRSHSAAWVTANLAKSDEIDALAIESIACFGRVDCLINCASVFAADNELEGIDGWSELMMVNAFSAHQLALNLQSELSKQKGSIVNLLDIRTTANTPLNGCAAYSASKAALLSLTKSEAKEFAPEVRVNAVAPGVILPLPGQEWSAEERTRLEGLMLLGKLASVEDIADGVLFMATAPAITGQTLTIDCGEGLAW